ncbi:sulfite exporter TauE/SafE family protein [Roseinatronobacter alkalisoli]|uniref:Probable membrane transporter protein n=1 Tax=Roseinatronobacter alkalisoli TaxID=3028235 RepID=A0ABT5TBJ4_9RHOB|nr:sulfite exporter TauE/SafE family protein [Roseinatronobacter sp. HJB301]MDD7972490.1 sulfite exporter TauE/SafE family protein [Roseinatronobacter sp. HJB301]
MTFDPVLLAQLTALLVVIGAFAGVVAGLLGVGGGIVLVPAFFYLFTALGYGGAQVMQVCLATSLATIIVTSARSVQSHNRRGAVEWPILRGWALGIGIGAVIGVLTAAMLRSVVLQGIFGVLGVLIGLWLAFGRADFRLGNTMPTGPLRGVIASAVGFLSVLMGIGGGSLGVPLMTLYGMPIHRAVATAAGFGILIAVPSVLFFLFVPVADAPPLTIGAVNLPAFGVVVAMTLITAPWGAKLAHALDATPLKRVFAAFIILMALNMLRKALGW